MAEYKVVDTEKLDAELKNLADKIREKGGTTEELDFYQGDFTKAVGAIEGNVEGTGDLVEKAKTHDWMQAHLINDKKNVQSNLFISNANITEIPAFDFSQMTNFYRMFFNCSGLISVPSIDTSSGVNFGEMFRGCTSLLEVPPLNTSKGTNMSRMFNNYKGTTFSWTIDTTSVTDFSYMFEQATNIEEVKLTSTYNGTNFLRMFQSCSKLKTISTLDLSNCEDNTNMFAGCSVLENVSFELETIKMSIAIPSSKLSDGSNGVSNSIQSIIDGLADLTGGTTQTLTLHADVRAKLTETQLATITAKNWSVA